MAQAQIRSQTLLTFKTIKMASASPELCIIEKTGLSFSIKEGLVMMIMKKSTEKQAKRIVISVFSNFYLVI